MSTEVVECDLTNALSCKHSVIRQLTQLSASLGLLTDIAYDANFLRAAATRSRALPDRSTAIMPVVAASLTSHGFC
jgi:hypothetical protein